MRRVEAFVGIEAFRYLARERALVAELAELLKAQPDELAERVSGMVARLRDAEKELAELRGAAGAGRGGHAGRARPATSAASPLVTGSPAGLGGGDLRTLALDVRGRLPGTARRRCCWRRRPTARWRCVAALNPGPVERGLSAGDLVKAAAPAVGGRGGGKPDVAQGGGTDPAGIPAALQAGEQAVAAAAEELSGDAGPGRRRSGLEPRPHRAGRRSAAATCRRCPRPARARRRAAGAPPDHRDRPRPRVPAGLERDHRDRPVEGLAGAAAAAAGRAPCRAAGCSASTSAPCGSASRCPTRPAPWPARWRPCARAKDESDLDRLAALVVEHEVTEVVVGEPRHLSGASGASARDAENYAQALAGRTGDVPVLLVDERLSTVSAASNLRASGRTSREQRSVIDQAAAVVILQSYLDARRSRA